MHFVDLKTQYQSIKNDVQARINNVLEHGQYILGPEVYGLEEKLADFVGVKHCVSVSSGTDALLIAMMALNLKAGDEVITSPFSFFATVEVIAFLGAKPVFVDIDPRTYNIDVNKIEAAITSKTKLIMPVSLYGQCADFDVINAIAQQYNLPVIEDAAQSLGATYKSRQSCGLSTIGCTSFFPSKPLGCYGDGGACFTDDALLAKAMRDIRNHGQDRRYNHPRIGINGRLDTLQAAILLAKLEIFPAEIAIRQQVAATYDHYLQHKFITPYVESFNTSSYAQYTIALQENFLDREAVQNKLQKSDIPTAVHYPISLHQQPAFAAQYRGVSLPIVEKTAQRVLSLPMHPYLKEADIQFIAEKLLAI